MIVIPPSRSVKNAAYSYISQLVAEGKLSPNAKLGKTSRYYLVKFKYNGAKLIEMFGLTVVGKEGIRDFGWVLLKFGKKELGGRSGIISLTSKSKSLTGDLALYSTYISRWNVETNVAVYVPYQTYENIEVEKVNKNNLILRDVLNNDRWIIARSNKDDDFIELVTYIESMKS